MIFIGTLSARACCMNVLTVVSPGLKVLFERVGKPEVINRPDFFRLGGTGAVIACNHVGWADSLWLAYAVYPRQLRYMSKQELFGPSLSRWVLEHVGSIPIARGPVAKFDQGCGRHSEARWSHPDLPERHAKRPKYCFQAWCRDGRASRSGSACARLLSRPEADASRASPAPTPDPGDIRVTDPNSGVTLWERDDD